MGSVKLNFGCGGNILVGWENRDIDVDISKKLPYSSSSVDYIFAEHCVEHITQEEAFNFFEECYRILKPVGFIRIAVPSVSKVRDLSDATPGMHDFLKRSGWSDGTNRGAVRSLIVNHGHKSYWSIDSLSAVMYAAGFDTGVTEVGKSSIPEFVGIEGHGKVIGNAINDCETIVCEGYKLCG